MNNQFKKVAGLIGDPMRATILWTLLDGRAFTATELAIAAETSPQNMSMHISKLLQAGLLQTQHQGRHRYYSFANNEVAYAIEALANVTANNGSIQEEFETEKSGIKYCRTCYDHLAGKVAVDMTDTFLQRKLILLNKNEFVLTKKGKNWFADHGIEVDTLSEGRRSLIRPCLDWSERRFHLAGSLGAAVLKKMEKEDWIRRKRNTRAVVITGKGQRK
ncbi:MAG TPA: helix-turn-helix transcriptional regulator, partial [Puia sp.]|nr:helix-turn-helix transcriptional regulator [Puia sp.]